MRPKTIATCLLLCAGFFPLFITSSFGQLTKVWQNDYPYVYDSDNIYFGYITGNKLQFDGSGNSYFFCEFTPRNTNIYYNEYHAQMQTIKYSAAGTTVWTHRDTSLYQNNCSYCGLHPYKVIVSNDGTSHGVASDDDGASARYTVLAATQPTGVSKWRNTSIGYGSKDVVQDNQGNNIVMSTSETIDGYGKQYIILTKVNPAGNTNWTRYFSSPDGFGWTQYQNAAIDKYGNTYVASSTYYYTANIENIQNNLYLMKFDTSGTLIWKKTLEKASYLYQPNVNDIIYNPTDDCAYISYYYYASGQAGKLRKVSAAGDTVWAKVISTGQSFGQSKLKRDKQGNIYYWTSDQYYGQLPAYLNDEENLLVKYNSAGNEIGRMNGNSFDIDDNGYTYTSNYFFDNKTYRTYDAVRKYSPNCVLLYQTPATGIQSGRYTSELYTNGSGSIYNLMEIYDAGNISVAKYSAACSAVAAPAKPKSITGSAVMTCDGSTSYTYSIAAVANANYYNWTVPVGVTINAGQGTTKIYVSNGLAFKTGTISVYAANCYGASAVINKAVNDTLKIPSAITGPASVCKGQTYVQYSLAAVAGANDYAWTVPANASIVCGNHTNSICVSFGVNGGAITVTAYNSCGTASPVRSKQVKVTNCIAGITVEAERNKSIAYPNPSSGAFVLRFGNGHHSAVSVVVRDIFGKVVEQLSSVTGGSVSFGSKLVSGVYFVEVMSGKEKEVLKVVRE